MKKAIYLIMFLVLISFAYAYGEVLYEQPTKSGSGGWVGFNSNYHYLCTNFTVQNSADTYIVTYNVTNNVIPSGNKLWGSLWSDSGGAISSILANGTQYIPADISGYDTRGFNFTYKANVTLSTATKYWACLSMFPYAESKFNFKSGGLASQSMIACEPDGTGCENYGGGGGIIRVYNTSSAPTAEPTKLLDVILKNNGDTYIDLLESDYFFVYGNHTWDNETIITDANCNFTITNSSAVLGFPSTINITLTSADLQRSLIFTESNTFTRDVYGFEACSSVGVSSLDVYINDDLIETQTLPRCSVGTHIEFTNLTNYTAVDTINYTLKCNGCGSPSQNVKLVTDGKYAFTYLRTANSYTEDMTYNSTTSLYGYNSHPFQAESNFSVNMTCDDKSVYEAFTLGNVNLSINWLDINGVSFTEGLNVEANDSYLIEADVFGDIIAYITMNVTFASNNSLVKQVNDEIISFFNNQTYGDGLYNVSIYARDDDGFVTQDYRTFYLNDTVYPNIAFTAPNEDNSTQYTYNSTEKLNVLFSDVNLFAYECLVYDPLNALKYNFTAENIQANSYNLYEDVTYDELGVWKIQCEVSDSHTDSKLDKSKSKYKIDDRLMQYEFKKVKGYYLIDTNISIIYTGGYTLEETVIIEEKDRYSWNYSFYLGSDKFKDKIEHSFRLECENPYHIKNSEYNAHFVCDNAFWVDFENENVIDYKVYKCGIDCFDIFLTMRPEEKVHFSSIGGVNFNEQHVEVEVVESVAETAPQWLTSFNYDCKNDSIQDVLMYMFIFAILLGLWILCFTMIKVPILTILIDIGFIIFGFSLIACNAYIGGILILVALMMALIEAIM